MPYITTKLTAYDSIHLSNQNTGLGNVLFQIASVYGLANTHGYQCTFPYVKLYCEKLKKLYNFDHYKTILRNFYNEYEEDVKYGAVYNNTPYNKIRDINLVDILSKGQENICVYGYLEVPSYFQPIREKIQYMYSPDQESIENIKRKYIRIFDNSYQNIAIHFRTNSDISLTSKFSNDYYTRAVTYCKKTFKNPHFYIFADNITNVSIHSYGITENYTIIEGNPDYIDLWLMANCDHVVTTTSTFCWWGVYLNKNTDGHILYDKDFSSQTFTPLDYSFVKNYIGI